MYHSITFTFGDGTTRNTWEHWKLIPTSRPVFAPPKTKTKYISVPGTYEDIDLTEAIKGYPVYENRTGSFEFIVDNIGSTRDRAELHEFWYRDMLGVLNGKKAKAVLEDDPCHYYEGRFFVTGYSPEAHWNKVTIKYEVVPYKLRITTSVEPWLWDPFNFDIGITQDAFFNGINVNGHHSIASPRPYLIGRKPVCPVFRVTNSENGIQAALNNMELGISVTETFRNGSTQDPRFILSDLSGVNILTLTLSGQGTVSVDFRSGGL